MKNKIYDRKNNKYIYEENNKSLTFLYNTVIGRVLLKILNKPFISKACGIYMNSKISKTMIKRFIKKHKINEEKIISNGLNNYCCFNDFFSRKYDNIEFSKQPKDFISIAQSRLLVYKIDEELKLNVKDTIYSLEELLKDKKLANQYKNGLCLIFRLIPSDYHRYIYADKGTKKENKKVQGVLHTVKPIKNSKYKVYKENTREYSILCTKNLGEIIQMEVGALLVGKIVNYHKEKFEKGEEKGYFQFGGSTVILIIKDNIIKIDNDISEMSKNEIETLVDIGETIGEVIDTKNKIKV